MIKQVMNNSISKNKVLVLGAFLLIFNSQNIAQNSNEDTFNAVFEKKLPSKKSDRIIAIAKLFINKPYVTHLKRLLLSDLS
jgi:hypothetical protein